MPYSRLVLPWLAAAGVLTVALEVLLSATGQDVPFSVELLAVRTDTVAGEPHAVPADGRFWIVSVAVDGNQRFTARVVDDTGRAWDRARDVERLLTPQADVHQLVFDLADGVGAPALEIRPRDPRAGTVHIPLR